MAIPIHLCIEYSHSEPTRAELSSQTGLVSLSFLTHKMRSHFCPKGVAKVTHVKTHTEDLSLIGTTCRICAIASPRRLGVLFQFYRRVNWGKKKLSKVIQGHKISHWQSWTLDSGSPSAFTQEVSSEVNHKFTTKSSNVAPMILP